VVKLPAGADGAKVGLERECSRRKESGKSEARQTALELLERGARVRFLHPAQDVTDGVLFYGFSLSCSFETSRCWDDLACEDSPERRARARITPRPAAPPPRPRTGGAW
jgi:hypothetical protein